MNFQNRDIISMNDLTREEIDEILSKVGTASEIIPKRSSCAKTESARCSFSNRPRARVPPSR